MGVSGIGMGNYQAQDGERLAQTLREQRASQPSLSEMMKDAREQAEQREKMFQIPKDSRRYGDAPVMAYAKLARARSVGEVDAASGYARRQMAQLRAAKRSDPKNADRIQAAINQLQKAVNRAGRKKRELSQEKLSEVRRARLEKEKRAREAKRLRQQLKERQARRMIRESGYLREAVVDDKVQSQLSAAKLALRDQMQELSDRFQPSVEDAVQQYAASAAEPAPAPEISVEA
ncbi:MAG: hypothetical protein HFF55_08290 [Lawsonibacter sp.]|jgi:hypothetical protein|nr:hypothetical protein [Lawsonibacter sp.]MCI9567869.1 hypothetical protein [Lawsonibacter sp.]